MSTSIHKADFALKGSTEIRLDYLIKANGKPGSVYLWINSILTIALVRKLKAKAMAQTPMLEKLSDSPQLYQM
ncbi:hypothetical protein H6G89_12665 [Oscillatoria sp. FACHB-1407]|uniref:hypothetical protein n=1 Tax=Oscillatoria sp. FACHB-1407 TaxID=2692847 RepID=UPI001685CBD8|nr:hypothetical protein [Oscillatoria sp. FACHB-1407]MBD2461902.1 hypothetical protein [Oscillatoria sp. FACHB-1407]